MNTASQNIEDHNNTEDHNNLKFVTLHFILQGGPQKCLYFSLAITFTKIRKPPRFFLHRYWKFIEFFWWKPP